MKIKNQYIEPVPEYWLSYLINGERDGLLFNEFAEIKNFESDLLTKKDSHFVIDPWFKQDNEHYFGVFNGIGHTLIDIQITIF